MIGILKAGWNAVECFINTGRGPYRPRLMIPSVGIALVIAEDLRFYAR
jgi:hypothetical protein